MERADLRAVCRRTRRRQTIEFTAKVAGSSGWHGTIPYAGAMGFAQNRTRPGSLARLVGRSDAERRAIRVELGAPHADLAVDDDRTEHRRADQSPDGGLAAAEQPADLVDRHRHGLRLVRAG